MTSIKTLPLLEDTKLIVLDEGVNAMYARKLVTGWIQVLKEKDSNCIFNLLLFSNPKSSYQCEYFASNNVNIFDYYTVNINNGFDISAISEKDFYNLKHILKTIDTKSTVVIDCLTSLILFVGLSRAMWFLQKLSKDVSQVICIYRRDFVQDKVSYIETLGSTYVKIQKCSGMIANNNTNYIVEFMHRKGGGGILKQQEIVSQNSTSYEIESKKLEQNKKSHPVYENPKLKIESSFRIEVNENEMKQRKEVVLPYTANTNTTNTSRIHYHPEDIDDFDEEDPDDDLCF
ncbi:elongator complex protein 5 [Bombus pyrosoma]|uniref:elongator complex protein 5 n=1 Tax=Bombus pyrosoma TaxID=396416 RepID=UPI001CB99A56|nr:elongator complex protein 5 [Bombus pyrosoma]XP_043593611.1 elongator complex protein 5 [Bombus pyrosoma]